MSLELLSLLRRFGNEQIVHEYITYRSIAFDVLIAENEMNTSGTHEAFFKTDLKFCHPFAAATPKAGLIKPNLTFHRRSVLSNN